MISGDSSVFFRKSAGGKTIQAPRPSIQHKGSPNDFIAEKGIRLRALQGKLERYLFNWEEKDLIGHPRPSLHVRGSVLLPSGRARLPPWAVETVYQLSVQRGGPPIP